MYCQSGSRATAPFFLPFAKPAAEGVPFSSHTKPMFFSKSCTNKNGLCSNPFRFRKVCLAYMGFHQRVFGSFTRAFLLASIQWNEIAMLVFLVHVMLNTLKDKFCVPFVFVSERFTMQERFFLNSDILPTAKRLSLPATYFV